MADNPLVVLHLSDIHIEEGKNTVTTRAKHIVAAVRAEAPNWDGCIVAVSGDIANTGSRSEYQVAIDFFTEIRTLLLVDRPGAVVGIVVIPGNHDCDFRNESELRSLTIENVKSRIESLDPAGDIASTCLAVHKNFFEFESQISKTPTLPAGRLYYEREFQINEHTVRFQCHNSAWTSRLREMPGTIYYPVSVASGTDSPSRPVALAISLIHHPFNWYAPENARVLHSYLERASDLVLTGHEHLAGAYDRSSHTGAHVTYWEGAALQESPDIHNSEFHVVVIDLANRSYQFSTYKRDTYGYDRSYIRPPSSFARNPLLVQHSFDISADYLQFLTDPGTAFSHPRKRDLVLTDLFIYPDLTRRSWLPNKDEETNKRVMSNDVLDFVINTNNVVIVGAAASGKTSLAKTLYLDLKRRKGVVPVMLRGGELRGSKGDDVQQVCTRAFEEQYGVANSSSRYGQLERAQRIILVDDFDEARMTARAQQAFVKATTDFAGSVVVIAGDVFAVHLLSTKGSDPEGPFDEFALCSIREFGHALRGTLIEKWHRLGHELTEPETNLSYAVSSSEHTLNTLIGKNLVPSYPFIVLTLLQTMEAAVIPTTASGSYGYLYEALITEALSRASNRAATIDTKYTYLSRLAYGLYDSDARRYSREELDEITAEHFERFRIQFNVEQMLKELQMARILDTSDGFYYFKYRYIYCYFVARHLRDSAAGSSAHDTRRILYGMADRIYFEDHASILSLYLYLTRDSDLIRHLLVCARRIYSDQAPCDFDADVNFVNQLYYETAPLVLPDSDHAIHRELQRESLDTTDELVEAERDEMRELTYQDDLNDLLKITFAFKTLNVLGQVLRNFPGSLERELKRAIASECYLLGLRTLKAVLRIARTNLAELRTYFAALIQGHRPISGVAELAKITDETLIGMTLGCAFGIIKRVSMAVGLRDLSGTYDDVLEVIGPTTSAKLIDVAIRLDHFESPPVTQIKQLVGDLGNNNFTRRVLRDLVANHMYLFPVDFKSKQMLGAALDIKYSDARFLRNPDRKAR